MRWLFERNVLENEFRAAIFKYIKENPETYPHEIIRETSISRGTVLYHLDILLYAGIVTCLKEGNLRRYRTAQKAIIDAGVRSIGGEKLNREQSCSSLA